MLDFYMPMPEKTSYTLSKNERLHSQKRIDRLFAEGQSFISYPLRIVYAKRETEDDAHYRVSVLASVSKRHFKRAVKRNRVKRLIKEAYRLNKQEFAAITASSGCSLDIAFLYLKAELPSYAEIEKAMLKCAVTLREKTKKKEDEADS